MTNPAFTQVTFRGRNDNGTETTATWKANQGTNWTQVTDTNFRVRFRIDETASRAWTSKVWNLYYSTNGTNYSAVSSSTPVKFSASSNFAQGDDTTTQLTGGTGTFVTDNNGMCESAGATNSGSAGNLFEVEYSLQIDSTQATNGSSIYLRVYDGTSAIAAYTATPQITVNNPNLTIADTSCTSQTDNAVLTVAPKVVITWAEFSIPIATAPPVPTLVISDAYCTSQTDALGRLVKNSNVVTNDSSCTSQTDNVTIVLNSRIRVTWVELSIPTPPTPTLVIADAYCISQTDALGRLVKNSNVVTQDSSCVSFVETFKTTKNTSIVVADSFSTSQTDNTVLVRVRNLVVQDSYSISQVDTFKVVKNSSLVLADSFSTSQTDTFKLTKQSTLSVADSYSVSQADNSNVNLPIDLNIFDAVCVSRCGDLQSLFSDDFSDTNLSNRYTVNNPTNGVVEVSSSKFHATVTGTGSQTATITHSASATNLIVNFTSKVINVAEIEHFTWMKIVNASGQSILALSRSTTGGTGTVIKYTKKDGSVTTNLTSPYDNVDVRWEIQLDTITTRRVVYINNIRFINAFDLTSGSFDTVPDKIVFGISPYDSTDNRGEIYVDDLSIAKEVSLKLGGSSTLAIGDSYSTSQTDLVNVTKNSSLVVADSFSTSQSDTFKLTKQSTLTVADSFSTSQSDNLVLTKQSTLSVLDSYSISQTDSVVTIKQSTLTIQDSYSVSFVEVAQARRSFGNLFEITHEDGTFSEYTSVTNSDNHLSITTNSRLANSTYGLQGIIQDTTTVYGRKDLPAVSKSGRIRYRFYLDPNSVTIGVSGSVRIMYLWTESVSFSILELTKPSSYRLVLRSYQDDGTALSLSADITDEPHYIEVFETRATDSNSNDGIAELYVDGILKDSVATLDNNTRFVVFSFASWGIGYPTADVNGTIYIDEIKVNDSGNVIGPARYVDVQDSFSTSQTDNVVTTKSTSLVVQDAFCTSQSDLVLITKRSTLSVLDTFSTSQVDLVSITKQSTLSVQDCFSTSQTDSLALSKNSNIIVNDTYSTSQVDQVVLNTLAYLNVPDVFTTSQSDNVTLVQVHNLTVQDSFSTTQTDSVYTTQVKTLVIQDASSTTQSDNVVVFVSAFDLVVADSYSLSQVDNVSVIVTKYLVVQDSFSTSQVDTVVTTKQSTLVLADTFVTTQSDLVLVTKRSSLVVEDLFSTSQTDLVTVTKRSDLVVLDSYSVSTLDTFKLTQIHSLKVNDSFSSSQVDHVTGSGESNLVVADMFVTTQSDKALITKQSSLVVQDSFSSTQADNVGTTKQTAIIVQDVFSTSQTDTLALLQTYNLHILDTYVTTQIDNVSLSTAGQLGVNDSYSLATADTFKLVQVHNLTVSDSFATTQVDFISPTGSSTVTVQDSYVSTQIDTFKVYKSSTLAILDGYSTSQSDTFKLSQVHNIGAQDSSCVSSVDTFRLYQTQNLKTQDGYSLTQSDNIYVTINKFLVVQDTHVTDFVSIPAITQAYNIRIQDPYVITSTTKPTLGQEHNIRIANSVAIPVLDTVSIIIPELYSANRVTIVGDRGDVTSVTGPRSEQVSRSGRITDTR